MIEKDQTFTLEDQEGLTHRQARHAQLGREFILRNLLPGTSPPSRIAARIWLATSSTTGLRLIVFIVLKTPWTLRRGRGILPLPGLTHSLVWR